MMPKIDISIRGRFAPSAIELRSDGDAVDGTTLDGHMIVWDVWYRIDSWSEGTFMERIMPGATKRTIKDNRGAMVVQLDHGYDATLGDKPLGPIEELREDDIGVYYAVPLYDTSYNRDFVLPLLRGQTMDGRRLGSALGASHRFRSVKDQWDMAPKRSDHNPDGIPERTIREIRLFEFGPVFSPANPAATAGVRGMTDWYLDRLRQRAGAAADAGAAHDGTPVEATGEPPQRHSTHPNPPAVAAKAAALAALHGHRKD
jgi:phage head maturation protease